MPLTAPEQCGAVHESHIRPSAARPVCPPYLRRAPAGFSSCSFTGADALLPVAGRVEQTCMHSLRKRGEHWLEDWRDQGKARGSVRGGFGADQVNADNSHETATNIEYKDWILEVERCSAGIVLSIALSENLQSC